MMRMFLIFTMSILLSQVAWGEANPRSEPLTDDQQVQILDEAQASYDRGTTLLRTDPQEADISFRRAADRFQLLVDAGLKNGELFYNLGNAYFQSGDLGRAIANYLRAEMQSPRDPRLLANLAYARSLVRPRIEPEGSDALVDRLTFWHDEWPLAWRLGIFAGSWLALWLTILVRTFTRYSGFIWLLVGTGLISVAAGLSAGITFISGTHQRSGVVIADDVIVRKGNAESFSPQFERPINQGLEFLILEDRPQWIHIELVNGKSGWIPRKDATVIDDDASALTD